MKYLRLTISTTLLSIIVLAAILLFSNQNSHAISLKQLLINAHVPEIKFNVIGHYPHNENNFTEGIQLDNNYYYESSGLYRQSKVQKIELKTAKISQEYKLPSQYFGEGLTILNDKIYQLTYNEKVGFIYDKNSLTLLRTFPVNGQGWGLTNDGQHLIMSNGSSKLNFINLQSFKIDRSITVSVSGTQVGLLNELEYVHGKIFANVWMSTIILMISPDNGSVLGWLDIASLQPRMRCTSRECVANGILYDDRSNTMYVTGKYWPVIHHIRLLDVI